MSIGLNRQVISTPPGGISPSGAPVPLAAYTNAPAVPDLTNDAGRGVIVTINMAAVVAGGTVTVNIYGYDYTTGTQYLLLASAALSSVGVTVLSVFPGATAVSNSTANMICPPKIKVQPVHAGTAGTWQYSIGVAFVV